MTELPRNPDGSTDVRMLVATVMSHCGNRKCPTLKIARESWRLQAVGEGQQEWSGEPMHGWETRMLLKHYLERGMSKTEFVAAVRGESTDDPPLGGRGNPAPGRLPDLRKVWKIRARKALGRASARGSSGRGPPPPPSAIARRHNLRSIPTHGSVPVRAAPGPSPATTGRQPLSRRAPRAPDPAIFPARVFR